MSERMKIQRKREKAAEFPSIQSDALQDSPFASQQDVDEVPSNVQEVLSSSGQPLDVAAREFMEPRFGHDFSQVRVHTDERAVESAQAVNALAYTVGQDVVFGEGQYIPGTIEGKELLAHELTHVVQQGFKKAQGNLSFTQTENQYEQEANLVGKSLMDGPESTAIVTQTIKPAHIYTQSDPGIVRQKDNKEIDSDNQQKDNMAASIRIAMTDQMQTDLRFNTVNYITGLNAAATRFMDEVSIQLEAEHVQDQGRLLSMWMNYLGSFVTPAIAPILEILDLNPVGVALILGTMALLLDSGSMAPESTTAQKRKAITDYFIGPNNSVASEMSKIDTRSAAEKGFDRHKNLIATDTQENRMNIRRAFQLDLFQTNILVGYEVKEHLVNKYAYDHILRLWNLTTVTERAQSAFSTKRFGIAAGDSMDAFIDKVNELFPDFFDKMQTTMPTRYKYWIDQRGGQLSAKDIAMFRRDIEDLALTTRMQEFGMPGGVLPYSTIGPAR